MVPRINLNILYHMIALGCKSSYPQSLLFCLIVLTSSLPECLVHRGSYGTYVNEFELFLLQPAKRKRENGR